MKTFVSLVYFDYVDYLSVSPQCFGLMYLSDIFESKKKIQQLVNHVVVIVIVALVFPRSKRNASKTKCWSK